MSDVQTRRYRGGKEVWNNVLQCRMHLVGQACDDRQTPIYADMLPVLAAYLKKRVRNQLQNLVVADGRTGTGKSTLLIDLALLIDPQWDIKTNYVVDADDLRNTLRMHRGEKGRVTLYDEASVMLNSKNAMRRDDKAVAVLFDVLRSQCPTSLLALPNVFQLNKAVRTDHIDLLLRCPQHSLVKGFNRRGFFKAYLPSQNPWSGEIYWQCLGAGIYPDLTPTQKAEYKPLKRKHQMMIVDKFLADGQKDKGLEAEE